MADETEEVAEEVTEEVEAAVDPELDRDAVLAIVEPKFEEVLQLIAEIMEKMGESEEVAPSEDAEVEMSAQEQGKAKFSQVLNFLNKN